MADAEIRIALGTWKDFREQALVIRMAVFVEEQSVPVELEVDAFDAESVHALAYDESGKVVGTGRLLPDGRIGRMAVLREARRRGVGSALLSTLMDAARARGDRETCLSAQVHAEPFYARHGYAAEGERYDDAGIPHITMRRRL